MGRSKKSLVFLTVVVFCFSLLTTFVVETNASTCYLLLHTWDCDADVSTWNITTLLLNEDGSFDDSVEGGGYWGQFGSTLFLQYTTGCQPFYSGTKKLGTKQCTDGSAPGSEFNPGCWLLKKTRIVNCLFGLEEGVGTGHGPLTDGASRPSAK